MLWGIYVSSSYLAILSFTFLSVWDVIGRMSWSDWEILTICHILRHICLYYYFSFPYSSYAYCWLEIQLCKQPCHQFMCIAGGLQGFPIKIILDVNRQTLKKKNLSFSFGFIIIFFLIQFGWILKLIRNKRFSPLYIFNSRRWNFFFPAAFFHDIFCFA